MVLKKTFAHTFRADLPVLRRLLFEAGYCELKEGTEKRFHDYRHNRCVAVKSSSGLRVGGMGCAVRLITCCLTCHLTRSCTAWGAHA